MRINNANKAAPPHTHHFHWREAVSRPASGGWAELRFTVASESRLPTRVNAGGEALAALTPVVIVGAPFCPSGWLRNLISISWALAKRSSGSIAMAFSIISTREGDKFNPSSEIGT
jgi:hypothetical protein